MSDPRLAVLGSRVHGRAATATAVVRILVGVFFGTLKFLATALERAEFIRYGFPDSDVIVVLVGLVGGVRAGADRRRGHPGGGGRAGGRHGRRDPHAGLTVGGPFHLGFAPATLVANLYLLWAGSGAPAVDRRLAARAA